MDDAHIMHSPSYLDQRNFRDRVLPVLRACNNADLPAFSLLVLSSIYEGLIVQVLLNKTRWRVYKHREHKLGIEYICYTLA
jgi:hypothetical protein